MKRKCLYSSFSSLELRVGCNFCMRRASLSLMLVLSLSLARIFVWMLFETQVFRCLKIEDVSLVVCSFTLTCSGRIVLPMQNFLHFSQVSLYATFLRKPMLLSLMGHADVWQLLRKSCFLFKTVFGVQVFHAYQFLTYSFSCQRTQIL